MLTLTADLPGSSRPNRRCALKNAGLDATGQLPPRDLRHPHQARLQQRHLPRRRQRARADLKLSANALYPADDYEWITKGGGYQVLTAEVKGERIPRIDLANPEKSLLLLKPTMAVAHGGGKRFETDSEDYKTILGVDSQRRALQRRHAGRQSRSYASGVVSFHGDPARGSDASPSAGNRALQRRPHGRLHAPGALHRRTIGEVASVSAERRSQRANGAAKPRFWSARPARSRALASASSARRSPTTRRSHAANFIDEHVFEKLRKFQIVPSELASDSEFLRRVCLDLTGTLPPPQRVREFLASTDPRKREKVIDALIASPEFVDYWTFRFADIFRVAIFANGLSPKWSQEYWEWIRANIESNRPYDEVARERISAEGYRPPSRHFLPYNQIGAPADAMAEEVRVFMGRRLDCAQCHNHPYENWSQDQFWGMAAFFSRMFRMGQVVVDHPANMDLARRTWAAAWNCCIRAQRRWSSRRCSTIRR